MSPVRSEVVIPGTLQGSARESFIDALYDVHTQIFDGVERDAFVKYVIDSPAERTRVNVYRDDSGRIVGYFAFHLFRRTIGGRDVAVLRGESGVLREHRGGAANLRFGFGEGIGAFARNLDVPLYYLGCLVHPTSYHSFCKYMRPVWPSVEHPPDAKLRALMSEFGDSFGLERVGEDPLVRHVGWRTRDTEAERAFWQRCDKPDVRFYIETNPGYGEGHGLLTLVPVDALTLAGGISRIAQDKGGFALAKLRSRIHQVPIASRLLAPREVRRRLRCVPLFEGLDDARVAALAARAEVLNCSAGRVLMTQGERGEELFVIDSGAVQVTASRGGEDVLLDQLDPGDVLGEIGALTNEPRTASARTATRATLIRIDRRALLEVMDTDPLLADSIWARYAERCFEYVAEAQPALGRMSRSECFNFLRKGNTVELGGGQHWGSRQPGLVFIVRGEVAIEQAGTRIVGRAPLLLDVGEGLRLEGRSAVRLIALPPPPLPPLFARFRPHSLLAGLSDAELVALLHAGRPVRREGGEPLFSAGDRADAFYLIERGAVEIVLDGQAIKRLSTGECFGERGLDPAGPGIRTAGARTVGETSLLRVVGSAFRRVAGKGVFGVSDLPGW